MADIPFQIILPSAFCSFIFFMTSQPFDGGMRLGMVIIMCILTSLVAQSLGLVIGCACDEKSAVFLGPISVIPLLLFSGFFIKLDNIPTGLHWISYVAFIRYGYEGTMVAIYGNDRDFLDCSANVNGTNAQQSQFLCDPKNILEDLTLEEETLFDIAVLSGFFVVLRLIGLFILWCKVKSER